VFTGKKMRNTHYIGLRLSEKDREILAKIAEKYGITISDVVRIAIKKFLENNEIKLKEVTT